jgi:hypothetical protein
MLDRDDVSPLLAVVNAELDIALETKTRGPVDFDVVDPKHPQYDDVSDLSSIAFIPLRDETIMVGLHHIEPSHVADIPGWEVPTAIVVTSEHLVRGALFTTKQASRSASKASSIIYFNPADSAAPIPGQIESAFSVPLQGSSFVRLYHFFVVRRYKVRSSKTTDVFLTVYPGFGARIYLKELSGEAEVIRSAMVFSHAWQRSWDADHMVTKSLNRVSCACSVDGYQLLIIVTENPCIRCCLVVLNTFYCAYCQAGCYFFVVGCSNATIQNN